MTSVLFTLGRYGKQGFAEVAYKVRAARAAERGAHLAGVGRAI